MAEYGRKHYTTDGVITTNLRRLPRGCIDPCTRLVLRILCYSFFLLHGSKSVYNIYRVLEQHPFHFFLVEEEKSICPSSAPRPFFAKIRRKKYNNEILFEPQVEITKELLWCLKQAQGLHSLESQIIIRKSKIYFFQEVKK